MFRVFSVLVLSSMTFATAAMAAESSSVAIARYSERLGQMMNGTNTSRVRGETVQAQLRDYAKRVQGIEESLTLRVKREK